MGRITSLASQYLHFVSSLPAEAADDLTNVLSTPPAADQYQELKTAILSSRTLSEHSRMKQLVTAEELGDRRRSKMLRQTRQLLRDQGLESDKPILRELFLQRLPQSIVPVPASMGNLSLQRLADMADRVIEYFTLAISAVSTPPSGGTETSTSSELADPLTRTEEAIAALPFSSGRSRQITRRSSGTRSA